MDGATSLKPRERTGTTLNKPVAALAIVPLNKSLTVTARKAYNVMLHIAQREGDTGDAGFSAPLNSILRGFGVGNNISSDAKRYIDQMASTKIEWRPLAQGEQWQLSGEGQGGGQAVLPDMEPPQDELRIFHMLAEVRLYKKGGENWVTWYYPPTIKEQILGPHRWARLELEVIARLSTYTSVALYEICARYRDNPGGVTSRHPWQWWVPVLRGSDTSKQREWRKFKNEFVNPAIREINELSDIDIELIEFKQGRAVSDVQFSVRKKPANALLQRPEPPDVTNLLHATRLGIRETDAEALIERYGEQAMAAALAAMDRYQSSASARPIMNKTAYLKTILAGQPLTPATPTAETKPAAMPPVAPRPGAEDEERKAGLLAEVRVEFEALEPGEQAEWMQRLRRELVGKGGSSPAIVRRLDAGQWQSPLVTTTMLHFYAEQTRGPAWFRK
jgi:hypothetical protein